VIAQVPKGLEQAVVGMQMGEQALVIMGPSYGYSDTRRPKHVPGNTTYKMTVSLIRFEKEKNLHQMSTEDKLEFCRRYTSLLHMS
jgi:FKBP-type peptidyl-prolyl cis-trans isomerase 2